MEDQKELPLLYASQKQSRPCNSSRKYRSAMPDPSLDLQLSINVNATTHAPYRNPEVAGGCLEAVKWQAEEHIRLAAMEKAYAERVRELTRREMELAQTEFTRARVMWKRAREEIERAEIMKERATRNTDSTSFEVTCQSCTQRFRP